VGFKNKKHLDLALNQGAFFVPLSGLLLLNSDLNLSYLKTTCSFK
jgi:hypothetical protein